MSRPGRKLAVVAISFALLASQSAALVHELTATHSICVEHGEVVEGSGGVHPSANRDVTAWTASSEPTSVSDHAHCAVIADRREERTLPQVVHALWTMPAQSKPVLVEAGPFARAVAVYRLAPKADPPA